MIQIDGSLYSGSGTIVRQAVMFAALTDQAVHIVKARSKRPKPGLRRQHVTVVKAIGQLVNAEVDGLAPGSMEIIFRPGTMRTDTQFKWDIGSAGSTTMLALAVLPVLAFCKKPVDVELRGGLFQDFAPSFYHLQNVVLPLLRLMGLDARAEMERPGYVPRGEGIVCLAVAPVPRPLAALTMDGPQTVRRVWGIALASHLGARRVGQRMAQAAKEGLTRAGYEASFEVADDTESLQPGAALAAFADLEGGGRLGADRAGALGRSAESIGKFVAKQLSEDLKTGATLDRHATDQMVPFAALADGESRFRVPMDTDHLRTNAWLAEKFLGAKVLREDHTLSISGVGFLPTAI